ncbi:MAG: hypothetical protein RIC29_08875 [Rhodospirillaceae bacterium]
MSKERRLSIYWRVVQIEREKNKIFLLFKYYIIALVMGLIAYVEYLFVDIEMLPTVILLSWIIFAVIFGVLNFRHYYRQLKKEENA